MPEHPGLMLDSFLEKYTTKSGLGKKFIKIGKKEVERNSSFRYSKCWFLIIKLCTSHFYFMKT